MTLRARAPFLMLGSLLLLAAGRPARAASMDPTDITQYSRVTFPMLTDEPTYCKFLQEETIKTGGVPKVNRSSVEMWMLYPAIRMEWSVPNRPARVLLITKQGRSLAFNKSERKATEADNLQTYGVANALSEFLPLAWGMRTLIGQESVHGRVCDVYTIEFPKAPPPPPPPKKKKPSRLDRPTHAPQVTHKPVKEWVWRDHPTFVLRRETERRLDENVFRERFEVLDIAVGKPIASELFESTRLVITETPTNQPGPGRPGLHNPQQLLNLPPGLTAPIPASLKGTKPPKRRK